MLQALPYSISNNRVFPKQSINNLLANAVSALPRSNYPMDLEFNQDMVDAVGIFKSFFSV